MVHIGVNLQPSSDTATDAFIATYGLEIVGDDYTTNPTTTWNVRNQFFPESGQPLFAVIALVPDSPTHEMGELLVRYAGYGQTQFSTRIAQWRAVIDTVQPAPEPPILGVPEYVEGGSVAFMVRGEVGCSYDIQVTRDFVRWDYVDTVEMTSNTVLFTHSETAEDQGFYRAVENSLLR